MHKAISIALAAGALAASGAAYAQNWDGGARGYGYDSRGGDWTLRTVCSGERARRLEGRLRHEVSEGDIDGRTADRMHQAIDRLEDRSRNECAEGDRRGIWSVSQQFDRIQAWMENAGRGGWRDRDGWSGRPDRRGW